MIRTRSITKAGRSRRGRRDGFTLVELLLVISIIGILATVSISVTRQVYHTARVAKTDSTIMKIDRVIMDMYAGFENRRVPSHNFGSSDVASKVTQAARLWLLRDMIRMEMPSNKAEIDALPVKFKFRVPDPADPANKTILVPGGNDWSYYVSLGDSPLRRLYFEGMKNCNGNFESAKCLFLIIMYGNPEARELFFDHEIATDDDGLSYFVDGWGNPIYYLRWAPGLTLSERQPRALGPQQNANDWSGILDEDKNSFATNKPDPLDPTEVGGELISDNTQLSNGQWIVDLTAKWSWRDADNNDVDAPVRGWALLPVVMSSGGEARGKNLDEFGKSFGVVLQPGAGAIPVVDPFKWALGAPSVEDKNNDVYANHTIIHNHRTRR